MIVNYVPGMNTQALSSFWLTWRFCSRVLRAFSTSDLAQVIVGARSHKSEIISEILGWLF